MLKELASQINIFKYITFRASYAAVTALILSLLFGPWFIRWLRRKKLGQEVRDDGPQTHLIKEGTPTMGGMLIIFAIVISVLLWQDLRNWYTWLSLFAILGFGSVGFADDWLKISRKNSEGLSPRLKMMGQILISAAIVVMIYLNRGENTTMLYIPFNKYPVCDLGWFYIPFGIIILVGASNAVNLTDGLDGLAIGLVFLVAIGFAILAYITGRADFAAYLNIPFMSGCSELAVLSLALIGASIGFLWFNCHPAEVFMGDTGSLSLGGIIGLMALLLKKEILLILIGGIFVIEALSVIIQVGYFKYTEKHSPDHVGKRVFLMTPIHHHFEKKGWKETRVVTRFWILGGLLVVVALSTLKLQ
ncbi:MAG: phospho-N-acetylmuramoyl-pentapeptide-transferase [Spirochaetia bacterium]|nr:phospho-N-acetylmuramoyl-pentapeptide-transferase [Spirochaetia bacterium]MBP5739465.1 phospho-N-acetylmuramoyl-pentapeptide-transferase [Spirochaetia bacterium]